jgi:dTDP-4-dehydrorhamnose 3,5-epimerase
MQLLDTALPEVKIIQLDMYPDTRGFFCERFVESKFAAFGFHEQFVQDNHSRSQPGVVRGLHFQHTAPQGKLVGVTRGKVLDVAVDVRPNSPNYKRYVAVELSDENATLLWIPSGFAHGFCVLGDEPADVIYKVTAVYQPGGEAGIRFDDPSIAIDWPIEKPLVSDRDSAARSLADIEPDLLRWFA